MHGIVINLIFELYLILNLNIEKMTTQKITSTASLDVQEINDFANASSSYRRISENEFKGILWVHVLAANEQGREAYYDVDVDLNDLMAYAVYEDIILDYYPTKEGLIITMGDEPQAEFINREDVRDRIQARQRFTLKEFLETIDPIDFFTNYFEDGETDCIASKAY